MHRPLLPVLLVTSGLSACIAAPLPEHGEDSEGPSAETDSALVVTHGTMSVSTNSLIVDQALVRRTPSYISAKGSGWWFCGQSAMASAINLIRGTSLTSSAKVSQLEWFHQQLLVNQVASFPYTAVNHFEANIDALQKVTDGHPEFVVPPKTLTGVRETARDGMMAALDAGYLVVGLSQITVNYVRYGHFKTVYKIERDAAASNGGWVYYTDSYYNTPTRQAFSTFLDDMGAAGANFSPTHIPHWSYLRIRRQ